MARRRRIPSRVATLEYVVEVAKDWTLSRFAAAQSTEFVLLPHRFELCGTDVRRYAISSDSPEASSPFDAVRRAQRPSAWSHGTVMSVLADSGMETVEFEQEVVEILAMDDDYVLAEAAHVIRISGFPPCLGPFWCP